MTRTSIRVRNRIESSYWANNRPQYTQDAIYNSSQSSANSFFGRAEEAWRISNLEQKLEEEKELWGNWLEKRKSILTGPLKQEDIITFSNPLTEQLDAAGYSPLGKPEINKKYVTDMIDRVPNLKIWYVLGGKAIIDDTQINKLGNSTYHPASHFLTLRKGSFHNNYRLLSTLYHEIFHSYQARAEMNNGQTIRSWVEENIGGVLYEYQTGHLYLEMQAYQFQIQMGDNNSDVIGLYNKKRNQYLNNIRR